MIAAGILLGLLTSEQSPAAVVVSTERPIRRDLHRFFGINLNWLRDQDANRPDALPLRRALPNLGVRHLRYPGGEKSDFHRWSPPPHRSPRPSAIGWYDTVPGSRMDFDAFLRLCRDTGADPLVVVPYDSPERTGSTEQELIDHAVGWVRYARSNPILRVRRWEIGNENWHNGTASPEQAAAAVVRFARAMKAADPEIKIGASGNSASWWDRFLPVAGPHLDFLTVSCYVGWEWKGYSRFLAQPPPDHSEPVRAAQEAILRRPEPERSRLRVIVAETNTKDYSEGGWPDANDAGHALVTFVTLGRLAEMDRVDSALIWTTRWADDAEWNSSMWYALNPENRPSATGRALQLWGRFARPQLLPSESPRPGLDVFASREPDSSGFTVWTVNRTASPIQVQIRGAGNLTPAVRFQGDSPADRTPKMLTKVESGPLPPYSVTVWTSGRPVQPESELQ